MNDEEDRRDWSRVELHKYYKEYEAEIDNPEEKFIVCDICNDPLIFIEGPIDDYGEAREKWEDLQEERHGTNPDNRRPPFNVRCKNCYKAIGGKPSDSGVEKIQVWDPIEEAEESVDEGKSNTDGEIFFKELAGGREDQEYQKRPADQSEVREEKIKEDKEEYIIAHCPPCNGDWIVTTERIGGKISGLIGGNTERTRLTCPYCGESFIVK